MNITQRFYDLKQILSDKHITMSDNDTQLHANMFDGISSLTHDKMSTQEMFEAFCFLRDPILNKNPKYAVRVLQTERIRAQLRMMEELPQTAGKLTPEEKEIFAFCVWQAACVEVFNEEKNAIESGMTEFSSPEHILKLYEWEKKKRPEFFASGMRKNDMDDERYGLDPNYPIMLTSIPTSYAFLNSLCYDGKKIKYSRNGSLTNSHGELIDSYSVKAEVKKLFRTIVKSWTIYINPNAVVPGIKAPKGFTLMPDNEK